MVVNITAEDPQPTIHSHINGTTEEILDRLCVTELLKGWPVYRDASEWAHYRNCFAEQAYIFTSKFSPLSFCLFTYLKPLIKNI